MLNEPLNSSESSKIMIFTLLLLPSVVFGFGVLPVIFLMFGLYMMKKNHDFSHIETANKYFNVYMMLVLSLSVMFGLAVLFKYAGSHSRWRSLDDFYVALIFAFVSFTYIYAIKHLFYNPLKNHKDWIVVNGIFSSASREKIHIKKEAKVDIIKGEKLKSYSVADELTKWAKLKEDGHITEEEFQQARGKLLKGN